MKKNLLKCLGVALIAVLATPVFADNVKYDVQPVVSVPGNQANPVANGSIVTVINYTPYTIDIVEPRKGTLEPNKSMYVTSTDSFVPLRLTTAAGDIWRAKVYGRSLVAVEMVDKVDSGQYFYVFKHETR